MKTPRVLHLIALSMIGLLVLSGVALAHTKVFPTKLSIGRSPSGTVAPGTRVTFSGKLSSAKAGCRSNSKVKLIKVGKGAVATDRTDSSGRYSFRRKVSATASWKTRFAGKVLSATHPHNHTCGASSSPRIRVPVG